MPREISEIIGRDGRGIPVYRALRALLCRDCGEFINEGALFSRWPLTQGGLRILPRCRKCVPLDFSEETPAQNSTLVDTLLDARDETDAQETPPPQQERIREEVSKRLSPALRRTRRPQGQ
ncbi:MAG TPA: hypothetical protein VGV59_06360 [Pyrinomonadaceae bacterium]|nr:hypothetical protein [Pyrinomonadaceae bacterium]